MASKWLGAGLLLAIAALILGWIFGMPKIQSMENDIQAALNSAGYNNISAEMSGNVATLSGEAASDKVRADALRIAENTECSACKNKRRWHEVRDNMTARKAPVIPTQTPYTFNGVKDASGSVVLSGYVPSQEAKEDVILKANRIFNTKVIDRTIKIAAGAPDAKFLDVTESYMKELALLDKGRFSQEGYAGLISGTASDVEVRGRINAIGQSLPGNYAAGFAANIDVPQAAAENVGEVKSESICQALFTDLKSNTRIQFATGRANIRGGESFDLLNKLASAANQCASFRIKIDGHTDNVGDAAYNQRLSQARADEVKNYLAAQQVEVDRMTAAGFGETNPVADNSTEAGRAMNRRISFTVTRAQ